MIAILRDRAEMLNRTRQFFSERKILEVDTPILSCSASIDAHIDLITARCHDGIRYLHSSPEYGMKRLLAMGSGDIYQLSHVFRDGEQGPRHNLEFTMAEWYRVEMIFEELITETAEFCRLFLGNLPLQILSYREAFQRYAGIDPFDEKEVIITALDKQEISHPYGPEASRDDLLNILLGVVVEPLLGKDALTALIHYPASQAALARCVTVNGVVVAERFELYHNGVELANGYHELGDSKEQRERFSEANVLRKKLGKTELPVDYRFLKALDTLPSCCGVAVGFDRLMMLRRHSLSLDEVIPLSPSEKPICDNLIDQ